MKMLINVIAVLLFNTKAITMNKAICYLSIVGLLAGCVSEDDLMRVQSQVNQLNSQLQASKNELQAVKRELAVVKGQRVVRLPTGAPMATRERSTERPNYEMSEQERLYDSAIKNYKSGNVSSAIQQFEQFVKYYSDDKNYTNALYYLGEAHYTMRHYEQAQKILEVLVYQTPTNKLNFNAITLLEKVYQAQGNKEKLDELNKFKQGL